MSGKSNPCYLYVKTGFPPRPVFLLLPASTVPSALLYLRKSSVSCLIVGIVAGACRYQQKPVWQPGSDSVPMKPHVFELIGVVLVYKAFRSNWKLSFFPAGVIQSQKSS